MTTLFRRRPVLPAVLVLATLVVSSCTTLRVGHDFDHTVGFSSYHSYSLMVRDRHGSDNPLVVQRARDAIVAELNRKGFSAAASAEQADVVVDFTIGAQDRTDVSAFPSTYVDYGFWNSRGWWEPYWGTDLDVRQYREGILSIDFFDARTNRPVWHGWAKKELTRSDLEHSEGPIRAAVAAVLATYPPG